MTLKLIGESNQSFILAIIYMLTRQFKIELCRPVGAFHLIKNLGQLVYHYLYLSSLILHPKEGNKSFILHPLSLINSMIWHICAKTSSIVLLPLMAK